MINVKSPRNILRGIPAGKAAVHGRPVKGFPALEKMREMKRSIEDISRFQADCRKV